MPELTEGWKGSPESLLIQLIALAERFIKSGRVVIDPPLFVQQWMHRRVLLAMSMPRIAQHLAEAISTQNVLERDGEPQLELVLDDDGTIGSTTEMQTWYTTRPNEAVKRSHINKCVYDSTWEASHAYVLDRIEAVQAWARNDHLGFEIWYRFGGRRLRCRPDLLVRLADGSMLILETKGQDSPDNKAKRKSMAESCRAVNAHGGFG